MKTTPPLWFDKNMTKYSKKHYFLEQLKTLTMNIFKKTSNFSKKVTIEIFLRQKSAKVLSKITWNFTKKAITPSKAYIYKLKICLKQSFNLFYQNFYDLLIEMTINKNFHILQV